MITNEKLCLLKYLVNKIGPKNAVEDINHLKIQHFFDLTTPKSIVAITSTKKIQIFKIQNPEKYCADPCLYICQVHSLGFSMIR